MMELPLKLYISENLVKSNYFETKLEKIRQ